MRNCVATVRVPVQEESIRIAAALLAEGARFLRAAEAEQPLFRVALAEVVGNAVKHGRGAEAEVLCEIEVEGWRAALRVFDSGPGFNPDDVPPPAVDGDVAALPESGFGLQIVRAVFPGLRTLRRAGRFGVELPLHVGG